MNRWQQVEKLCQSALELKESERGAFLDQACAGDEELRQEVESLLKLERSGKHFIEEPALEVAAKMVAQEPQSLIGQQLGSYQIVSLLGAGGMGVVYKASDTRLKRSVAIKVLPPDKVSDPERKRRFIQEARAASALNHPNIITIYDIGSEAGIDFVVMEYVAGKTLDQLIRHKGIRLNETLKLAVQMADALAKAHSAGIVHRDLKPSNVMVTDDGLAKVLDFGVAKLTEIVGDEDGTRTTQPQTETGTIVGTLSYMSPEQAEGKKVDARSDIFSFGAVRYEMATGQKAFVGESNLVILTAILQQDPKPVSQIVKGIPQELERIIHRCLRKDPERRFQHMGDVKIELRELKEESDSGKLAGAPPGGLTSRSSASQARRPWVWAGAVIAVVVVGLAGWLFRGTARNSAAAPEVLPFTSYLGSEYSPSFSPDGNQVAFSWNGEKQDNFDIYLKVIGSQTPVRLTTDPADDVSPAFSPDGRSIGFIRLSKGRASLILIPAIGGPERILADNLTTSGDQRHLFAWFPDGKSVVTDGLTLLSTESGDTRNLTSLADKSRSDYSPSVSPDGRTVAFSRTNSSNGSDVYLLNLTQDLKADAEPQRLTSLKGYSFSAAWTPNGREIIFSSLIIGAAEGTLWRVSASATGKPERLTFIGDGAFGPVVSRSGTRLAYERWTSDSNIWRLPLSGPGVATGLPARLIASTRGDISPNYSPNGERIAFESDRTGVHGCWISDADGSNVVELFSRMGASCGTARWSPDGQRIAFDFDPEGNMDVYVIRANGGTPVRLTTDAAFNAGPSWSRDGNWIYFRSNRTGRDEVWKVSATGGEAVPVTRNGGETAIESPDGKFIYYTKAYRSSGLWKMPVGGGQEGQVLPSVFKRAFSVVKQGIYFIREASADGKSSIQFLSFATGNVKTVAPMSKPPEEGLSVSPNGRSILFSQVDESGSDLMLVENFR